MNEERHDPIEAPTISEWLRAGRPAAPARVSVPRLPCGCPIDSGCDGYHAVEER